MAQVFMDEDDKSSALINFQKVFGISPTMNKKSDSFGEQLIKALAKQTKDQYKFENRNGTYFELQIPKIAA